ncbi:MAG: ATP-binding cassette domain-containing protein [Gammaproteobacteria bacterium]
MNLTTRAAVVETRDLTKVYADIDVVDHLNVEISAGSCWGLLGPNGAGKTTFLRMLIGNTAPSSGALNVLGFSLPAEAAEARRRIGVVPQMDNLDPDFTVLENLIVYGAYFDMSRREVLDRADDLLEVGALAHKADAPIATLSGGMQRRLSLIRALINDPELLILDEPTTGLDPQARQLIWQRLRELSKQGLSLVLTTHFMDEAERLCDQVTVMDHGKILDSGSPRELITRHIEPNVIEVHGDGVVTWHDEIGHSLADRHERIGGTDLYYVRDERALLNALSSAEAVQFLHRPANLEDVFVKLTGRDLRDG